MCVSVCLSLCQPACLSVCMTVYLWPWNVHPSSIIPVGTNSFLFIRNTKLYLDKQYIRPAESSPGTNFLYKTSKV